MDGIILKVQFIVHQQQQYEPLVYHAWLCLYTYIHQIHFFQRVSLMYPIQQYVFLKETKGNSTGVFLAASSNQVGCIESDRMTMIQRSGDWKFQPSHMLLVNRLCVQNVLQCVCDYCECIKRQSVILERNIFHVTRDKFFAFPKEASRTFFTMKVELRIRHLHLHHHTLHDFW